jgi:hypothetical protein
MKQWLSCALALLVVTQLVAAPAPPEKNDPGMTEKKETAPVEVDFGPLTKATAANFKIKFAVTSYGNTRTPMVVNTQSGSTPDELADLVRLSLPAGWDVQQDGGKLVIKSYKGSPIKSVDITLEGEKKELTPTVKRLKPEDKKEGK